MSPPPTRRRFIAGAVCPRCGEQDKIVVDLDTDRRECVSCDFSDDRPGAGNAATPAEPASRVTRGLARRTDTPAEAVKLVDPSDEKRDSGDN